MKVRVGVFALMISGTGIARQGSIEIHFCDGKRPRSLISGTGI